MVALMLPYTLAFWLFTGLFFSAWFLAGIPFGPGVSSIYVPAP